MQQQSSSKQKRKQLYTIQPRNGGGDTPGMDFLSPRTLSQVTTTEATHEKRSKGAEEIKDILLKKVAYLSGGKDQENNHILTIPNVRNPYPYTEEDFSTTVNYLAKLLEEPYFFAILVDVRSSSWNSAKPLIKHIQNYLYNKIRIVLILRPDEFWERKRSSFRFKNYKDKLDFKTVLVSIPKMKNYINNNQLTEEFGGTLVYNHEQWVEGRISYELYVNNVNQNMELLKDLNEGNEDGAGDDDDSAAESARKEKLNSPQAQEMSTSCNTSFFHSLEDLDTYRSGISSRGKTPVPAPRSKTLSSCENTPEMDRRIKKQKAATLNRRSKTSLPPSVISSHHGSLPRRPSSSINSSRATSEKVRTRKLSGRRTRSKSTDGNGLSSRVKSEPDLLAPNGIAEKGNDMTLPRRGKKLMQHTQSAGSDVTFSQTTSSRYSRGESDIQHLQNQSMGHTTTTASTSSTLRPSNKLRNSKRRSRRRTVTGLPEVDEKANKPKVDISHYDGVRANLDKVFKFMNEEGDRGLKTNAFPVHGAQSVEEKVKDHQVMLGKCAETFGCLYETLRIMNALSEARQSGTLAPFSEGFLEWTNSIQRNCSVVESRAITFKYRLQAKSQAIQLAYTCGRTEKKMASLLEGLMTDMEKEASLLDTTSVVEQELRNILADEKKIGELFSTYHNAIAAYSDHLQAHRSNLTELSGASYGELQGMVMNIQHFQDRFTQLKLVIEPRKNRLDQIRQHMLAQKDVTEGLQWLRNASKTIREKHRALGKSSEDVVFLQGQNLQLKEKAKQAYESAKKQLSALSVLRRNLRLTPLNQPQNHKLASFLNCGDQSLSPTDGKSLEEAWDGFMEVWKERTSRLSVSHIFHKSAEEILREAPSVYMNGTSSTARSTTPPYAELAHQSTLNPHTKQQQSLQLQKNLKHAMAMGKQLLQSDYRTLNINNNSTDGREDQTYIKSTLDQLKRIGDSMNVTTPRSDTTHRSRLSSHRSWVENMNETTEWLRIQFVKFSPSTFQIGKGLKEATRLQKEHEIFMSQASSVENEVVELLSQEERVGSVQSLSSLPSRSDENRKMQRVMSQSLLVMWNDLRTLLVDRKELLDHSIFFYTAGEEFGKKLSCMEQYLNWTELPGDVTTARCLLRTLGEMFDDVTHWHGMCTQSGRALMDLLTRMNSISAEVYKAHASFRSACSAIECSLESLFQRHRLVKHRHDKRKRHLEDALKLREWESQAVSELRWFSTCFSSEVESPSQGSSKAHLEALLSRLEKVKPIVQARLETVKVLIARGKEMTEVVENLVPCKCLELDQFCEKVMATLMERIKLINSLLKFHDIVTDTKTSLYKLGKKLEKGKFSVDPTERSEQFQDHKSSVGEAVEPVMKMSKEILHENKLPTSYGDLNGLRSIVKSIVTRADFLIGVINDRKEDAILLQDRWVVFYNEHERLSNWKKNFDEEEIKNSLFIDYDSACQLRLWLKEQENVLEMKSFEFENLAEKANDLLESGLFQPDEIYSRINPMKSAVGRMHARIKQKIHISEMFKNFLEDYEELIDEMKQLENKLAVDRKRKFDELNGDAVDKWNENLHQLREQVVECLQRKTSVIAELNGTSEAESNLHFRSDMKSAISLVESLYMKVQSKKSALTNDWLSWQYKASFNKEIVIEKQALSETIDDLISVIRKVGGDFIKDQAVLLGANKEENEKLYEKLRTKEKNMASLKSDIDQVVKKSEILGMKESPTNSKNGENNLKTASNIRTLLKNFNETQEKLNKLDQVLISAHSLHTQIEQMQTTLSESSQNLSNRSPLDLDQIDTLSQNNEDDEKVNKFANMIMSGHRSEKSRVDEEYMKIINRREELEDLVTSLDLEKANFRPPSRDIDEAVDQVHNDYYTWRENWRHFQDHLESQKFLDNFSLNHQKHVKVITQLEERFERLEEGFYSCVKATQISSYFQRLNAIKTEFQEAKDKWGEFNCMMTVSCKDPAYSQARGNIKKTNSRFKILSKRIESLFLSAKSLRVLMEKLEESEASNDQLRNELDKIRQRSLDERLHNYYYENGSDNELLTDKSDKTSSSNLVSNVKTKYTKKKMTYNNFIKLVNEESNSNAQKTKPCNTMKSSSDIRSAQNKHNPPAYRTLQINRTSDKLSNNTRSVSTANIPPAPAMYKTLQPKKKSTIRVENVQSGPSKAASFASMPRPYKKKTPSAAEPVPVYQTLNRNHKVPSYYERLKDGDDFKTARKYTKVNGVKKQPPSVTKQPETVQTKINQPQMNQIPTIQLEVSVPSGNGNQEEGNQQEQFDSKYSTLPATFLARKHHRGASWVEQMENFDVDDSITKSMQSLHVQDANAPSDKKDAWYREVIYEDSSQSQDEDNSNLSQIKVEQFSPTKSKSATNYCIIRRSSSQKSLDCSLDRYSTSDAESIDSHLSTSYKQKTRSLSSSSGDIFICKDGTHNHRNKSDCNQSISSTNTDCLLAADPLSGAIPGAQAKSRTLPRRPKRKNSSGLKRSKSGYFIHKTIKKDARTTSCGTLTARSATEL